MMNAPADPHVSPGPRPPSGGSPVGMTQAEQTQAIAHSVTMELEAKFQEMLKKASVVSPEEEVPRRRDPEDSTAHKVIKWGGAVFTIVAVIFGAGGAWVLWNDNNATDAELVAAVEPVKALAEINRKGLRAVTTSTSVLMCRGEWEDEILRKESELAAHQADYQEALDEHFADKAARRSTKKPRRTPDHIRLGKALEDLKNRGYNPGCQEKP